MSFKIRYEDFFEERKEDNEKLQLERESQNELEEKIKPKFKFVLIIPANYGKCVCLRVTAEGNEHHLFNFRSVSETIIAKALAVYLVDDDINLKEIFIKGKKYTVPDDRNYSTILEDLKKLLIEANNK